MRFLFVLFFLLGCSNLEFVYEKKDKNFLKNSTTLEIRGVQKNIVYSQFVNLIGKDVEKIYSLDIEVYENISKEVVGSDSATSKYTVSHTISYKLIKENNKCSLLEKKITTTNSYNSKSAGYNFGTDVSKTTTIKNNITNNIVDFLKTASALQIAELCKNED